MDTTGPLLHHKTTAPGLPAAAILRPRLTALFTELLRGHEAIAVFASAGSGKTVQTQLFAQQQRWPVAWLTLDAGDRSTSRMLTYLSAALAPHSPSAPAVLEQAFEKTSVAEEAAAVLAESIDVDQLLIVLDHCETIASAEETCSVLETFIDYLPERVRTVLLSRSELDFSLGRMLLQGRVGRVVDQDLALTLDEARRFAEARGEALDDLEERWAAAGGWMAAFAFGGPRDVGGADHERDFRSYIAGEVLGGLPADERQFLLDTSILESVSQRGAADLCGPESRGLWRRVAARHLPATISTDRTIVYHPCLRAFLREQLEGEAPERWAQLRQRHAELMLQSRQYEDSVELFLELDMPGGALQAARGACRSVMARGDWETYLRWADELGWAEVVGDPLMCAQLIKALRLARNLKEARALTRELDATGRLPEVLAADPSALAHMAWLMQWRPAEGLRLLDRYEEDARAAGVRYMLEVTSGDQPARPPNGLPWSDCDRSTSWALMVQGRLDELVTMLPSGDDWPPRNPFSTPHPLIGLIWRGEKERARELYDQVPESAKGHRHLDFWLHLEAWLLLVEGDADGAVRVAESAVSHSRRTGLGSEPVFEVVQGAALIAVGRVHDAIAVLDESFVRARDCGVAAFQEWASTMLGRARLELDEPEAAAAELRFAVDGMTRADRILMLPLAGVYLSEAEWRLGNAEAAAAAAAVALEAATRMGALPILQMALGQFPGVYRRQVEGAGDPRWRRITAAGGAASAPRAARSGDIVPVDVQTFGDAPDIVVGGTAVDVHRLKVLELVAYLAARPHGVPRDELQTRLFPASDRRKGSNHFRQVVHQLRKLTGISLERSPKDLISFAQNFAVDSTDLRFERLLADARGKSGRDRFARFQEALALADGPFLAASDLEWVSDRRFELDVRKEEAELELSRLALEFEEFDIARAHAEALLVNNPYSSPAYTILIEVELATGSEVSALAVYRRAVSALDEIGLTPGSDMARLVARA